MIARIRSQLIPDVRGNVAIIFALSLFALVALVGSVVDYARWSSVTAAVQAQVDSAALSAVIDSGSAERLASIQSGLSSRLQGIAHKPRLEKIAVVRTSSIDDPESVVRVEVEGRLDTIITRIIGVDSLPVGAFAEARRSPRTYEVSLVVDVTGSMKGAKITALRTASRAFVRALLPEATESDRILINIVPYTAAVNIGRSRANWLGPLHGAAGNPAGSAVHANRYLWLAPDPNVSGAQADRVARNDCRGTDVTWNQELQICHIGRLSVWTAPGSCPGLVVDGTCYVSDGWAGCVEERGRGDDDMTDATIATAGFRPYYWPSWGGVGNSGADRRYNSYLPGPIDESRATLANNNDGLGPNLGCPKDEISDWTNDPRELLQRIERFEAWHRGGTMGHVGLAWSWRTLSPQWAGMWGDRSAPRPYDRSVVEKIVVFMTDGENGFYSGHAPPNDGDYTAYGRLLENAGWTRSNQQSRLDAKMLNVCRGMRREGIEIFTVGFGLNNNAAGNQARRLLRDCASGEDHFFDATTANLAIYFENIATTIRARGERLAR